MSKKILTVSVVWSGLFVLLVVYLNTNASKMKLVSYSNEVSKAASHLNKATGILTTNLTDKLAQVTCDKECQWDRRQYDRNNILKQECSNYNEKSTETITDFILKHKNILRYLYFSDKHKVFYCEVPKAGCTHIKELFFAMNNNDSLEGIPTDLDRFHKQTFAASWRMTNIGIKHLPEIVRRLETYQSFLVTRHPFTRLVSAYTDKFVNHKNHPSWIKYRNFINERNGVRDTAKQPITPLPFHDFVKYLIQPDVHYLYNGDVHWMPVNDLCHPCKIRYDYIAKLETLEKDAPFILDKFGARKLLNLMLKSTEHETHSDNREILMTFWSNLTSDEIRMFNQRYEKDFRVFDYDKDYLK